MAARTTDDDTSGGSRLMGTNILQKAIDGLTNAIEGLEGKIGTVLNAPTPFNKGGSPAGGGGPVNSYSINGNPVSASGGWSGGALGGFANTPAGLLGAMSAGGGANGGGFGGGGGGTLNQQAAGGGNGGWAGFGLPTNYGQAVSQIGGYLMNAGGAQLPQQASRSSYIQQQSLMAGYNTTGFNLNPKNPYGFKTLNAISLNAQDQMQGNALLNYASGSALGNNNRGRAMYNAATIFGIANPGSSWTGSAQAASGLYSNTASMALYQMTGTGSLNAGTGTANSPVAIVQAILKREFGTTKVSAAQMAATFGPNGAGSALMNYLGSQGQMGGQTVQGLTNMAFAVQDVKNKYGNMSNSQIQGLFNGARLNNKADIAKLGAAGVEYSELQGLKTRAALQTQRGGEEYSGFNSGLNQVVGNLNLASEALNHFYNSLLGQGVATGIGYAHGAGAGVGLSGPVSRFITNAGKVGGGAAASTNSSGSGTTSKTAKSMVGNSISGSAIRAVGAAESQIGVPYVWGGTQPGVGFDCSGLIQWAYAQAGVKLPRTSGDQWSYLMKNHSVPPSQAREGDLVFMAGSDGTPSNPGHVGMMVSNNMLIQAPYTGADVSLLRYDPSQWQHAARPTGPGSAGMGSGVGGTSSGLGMASGAMGGYTEGGNMGSTDELAALAGAMSGAAPIGGGLLNGLTPGGTVPNGGSAGAPSGASAKSVMRMAQAMAAKRGWTGSLWTDLNNVEMAEAGWNLKAQNPHSKAFGIAQGITGPNWYYQYKGGNPNTAVGQVTAFLDYVQERYHGPAAAWQHEQDYHWYARGTSNASPGRAIVGERGPEVIDLKGGERITPSWQTAGLMGGPVVTPGNGRVGLNLTVNFQRGSINLASLSNTHDISRASSEIASQIADYLAQEQLIKNIAAGVS